MEWLVYWFNPKKGEIVRHNVFTLSVSFDESMKDIQKTMKKNPLYTFKDFQRELLSAIMYSFWCKSEHEIILAPWISNGAPLKIDVCDQLRLNWHAFSAYVWNYLKGEMNYE